MTSFGSGSRLALAVALALLALAAFGAGAQAMTGEAGGPTIASDQPDYGPGATVTLTGLGWQPGEQVHITVDDANGRTWTHAVDVTADDGGTVTDVFDLPTWFVALYTVVATGSSSGNATTSFTDAPAPTVTLDAISDTLLNAADVSTTLTWHASDSGTYAVRIGGNATCTTGTPVESGAYPTAGALRATTVPASLLTEGSNIIRICVTEATGSTGVRSVGVTKDTIAPSRPTVAATTPASPSNVNVLTVSGTADSGSTVRIYRNSTCTSAVAGTGTAITFASPGISISVTNNTTTTFAATATDAAGNASPCSMTSVTYVEDSTAPTITPRRSPQPNAAGWNNTDVTVGFECFDALAGLAAGSPPAPTTLVTEGQGQSVAGTCVDRAGNTASAVVAGIAIDRTPPEIVADRTPLPNAYGWNSTDVTVAFGCSDIVSGLAAGSPPPVTTLGDERAGQSVSGTCTDRAGNRATATVAGIAIDKTAPSLERDAPSDACTVRGDANWCRGVQSAGFRAADDVSGLRDPALAAFVRFADVEGRFVTIASGAVEDRAGNVASSIDASGFSIDATPPSIVRTPELDSCTLAGNDDWCRGAQFAGFAASDEVSGLADPSLVSFIRAGAAEGRAASVASGPVADAAGNVAGSVDAGPFRVDGTPPFVSYVNTVPALPDGRNGWYVGDVTANFQGVDLVSGFDASGAPVSGAAAVASTEGASVMVDSPAFTDVAGNVAPPGTAVSIPYAIDRAAPLLVRDTSLDSCTVPGNAGWCRGTQLAGFAASDALSGLADASLASFTRASTLESGEVAIESGAVSDVAGNVAAAVAAGPFRLDATPPSITGTRTPAANARGWSNDDVTVEFDCSDALSGLAAGSPPAAVVVSTEGSAQRASGACVDVAGNSVDGVVDGIAIDKTAPVVGGSTGSYALGTWTNDDVKVEFTCTDELSGVAQMPAGRTIASEGASQSARGECVDAADNSSLATVGPIDIDKTAPSLETTRTPDANANGWNRTDVTVAFSCTDGLSGLAAGSPPAPATLASEGAGQSVGGTCRDRAGNATSGRVGAISIDKSAPEIGATRTPSANAQGWNRTDVVVDFSCSDALSGVDSLTPTATVTEEGADQSRAGTCVDKAGNSSGTTIGKINIDKTAPTIGASRSPAANANGWNNGDVTVAYACADALSTVAAVSPPAAVTAEGAGQSRTGTCTDRAGNEAATTLGGINIDRTAPTTTLTSTPPARAGSAGATFGFSASDALSGVLRSDCGVDAAALAPCTSPSDVVGLAPGTHSFRVGTTDLAGNTGPFATFGWTIVALAGGPYTGTEGAAVSLAGAVKSGVTSVSWSYSNGADVDVGAVCSFGSASSATTTFTCTDDGTYAVTLTANDGGGALASTATVNVGNAAPHSVKITTPSTGYITAVGLPVTVSASFSDRAANDRHTCAISWGDGSTTPGTITESGGNGKCTGSHRYTLAGPYAVGVSVSDDDGGAGASPATSITVR